MLSKPMPTLYLVAVFAADLEPGAAWRERQTWKSVPAAELRGVDGGPAADASVRARWSDGWLCFEFICRDEQIVAPGREDNLDHFKLGDVVEIFIGRRGEPGYLEVHATPAGLKSVYAFRAYRKPAPAPSGAVVQSGPVGGGWRAVISIPWSALGGSGDNEEREFLAGRYDYAESGGRPVLSSFPPQSGRPDFHDRARYALLRLGK